MSTAADVAEVLAAARGNAIRLTSGHDARECPPGSGCSGHEVIRLSAALEAVLALAGDAKAHSWEGRGGQIRPVRWDLDPEAVREAITRELTGSSDD